MRDAGVMAASAAGASESGGLTIGVLPDDQLGSVAPDIDIPILTGLGDARNVVNVLSSRAVIAMQGSAGTISEVAHALKSGRKVVTINTEEGPAYGVALLAAVGGGEFKNVREACAATIRVVQETSANRKNKKYYDRAFPVYQHLYHSLKDDFKSIAALEK